ISFGQVGFDVQNRSAVDQVDTAEVERIAFDPLDSRERQPDVVGPMRAPRGEHADGLSFESRGMNLARDVRILALMKDADEPRVTKALQLIKEALVGPDRLKKQAGAAVRSKASLPGSAKLMIEHRANVSDRREGESILLTPHAAISIIAGECCQFFLG